MIQELFAGNTTLIGGGGDNNFSKLSNTTPSSSPLSCTTTTSNSNVAPAAAATANANASSPSNSENLRCPRCDSPNTKFCYYNNYNLTQPRHFCKTCRRYWTKGGALRNVPIGGGCRKNKTTITAPKSSAAKLKNSIPFELIGKSGIFGGFEKEIIPSNNNPFLFSSPHHQNHNPILSLLRGNNHHNLNFVKEEQTAIGMNSYNQFASSSLSSLWKNNEQNGTTVGEVQSSTGLQELYQRLKASTSRCYPDIHGPSSSIILESAPVAGGELGFWNPSFSTWSDLSTGNGAYL